MKITIEKNYEKITESATGTQRTILVVGIRADNISHKRALDELIGQLFALRNDLENKEYVRGNPSYVGSIQDRF
jgi:hypothetical protein